MQFGTRVLTDHCQHDCLSVRQHMHAGFVVTTGQIQPLLQKLAKTLSQTSGKDLQQAFVRKLLRIKFNFYGLCVTVTTADGVICGIGLAASCVTYSS